MKSHIISVYYPHTETITYTRKHTHTPTSKIRNILIQFDQRKFNMSVVNTTNKITNTHNNNKTHTDFDGDVSTFFGLGQSICSNS